MLYEILKALDTSPSSPGWRACSPPRLFVLSRHAEKGSKQSETFKVIERRLLRGVVNPHDPGLDLRPGAGLARRLVARRLVT